MVEILHQQRLLLELLSMSGNIAVPDSDNGTLLYKTLCECNIAGWIKLTPFGDGFNQAAITASGRIMIRNRRYHPKEISDHDRRRASA